MVCKLLSLLNQILMTLSASAGAKCLESDRSLYLYLASINISYIHGNLLYFSFSLGRSKSIDNPTRLSVCLRLVERKMLLAGLAHG